MRALRDVKPSFDSSIKRVTQPEEVSRKILFLASDEASYSTGTEFVINGRFTGNTTT